MRGFLLDTNTICEPAKRLPSRAVTEWLDGADEDLLFLSVLTFGEIRKGTATMEAGRRRAALEAWLDTGLPARFQGRVLPVDGAVAERWGELAARAKSRGETLPVIDGLLAATAIEHRLTVVSRNMSDFAKAQVAVVNPWVE